MAAPPASGGTVLGVRALRRADWGAARACFERALDEEDSPEAREGLGLALWFLGEVSDGIAERERAFEGYVAAGRCDDAARTAVWVSHQHLLGGRASAARGWLGRAERALEGLGPLSPGRGWVAVERARHTDDVHDQIRLAHLALQIGGPARDGDLEVVALSLLGRATVGAGRRQDGLALLEEAMAAATAGRSRDLHTLAQAYCILIDGCLAAGEWERGAEWCRLVDGHIPAARITARPLPHEDRTRNSGTRR